LNSFLWETVDILAFPLKPQSNMIVAKRRSARSMALCVLLAFACFAAGAFVRSAFIDEYSHKNLTADAVVGLGTDLAVVNRMREAKTEEGIGILRADMERHVLTLMQLEKEHGGDPEYEPQKRRLLAKLGKELANYPRPHLTLTDAETDAEYQAMQKELRAFLEKYR
jgi:hypothetical protein